MKKAKYTIKRCTFFLSVLVLISACGKSPFCWGDDKDKGIIEEKLSVMCFPHTGKEFVITNDSKFRQLFYPDTCKQISIDFNKYTLLGLYASGGCTMKIKREVIRDEDKKEYFYKVIARDCGMCKKMTFDYNFVLVPKLPKDWTVRFELKER